MLTPSEFLDSYCEIGYKKARSPAGRILLLAILAGILIGMGAVVSNTASHALENLSVARVVCGFLFPFGLVMVLFTGAELFTGNCLITIPVLERRLAWTGMLRNLCWVYIGNLIGAVLLAAAIVYSGQLNLSDGALAVCTIRTAAAKSFLWQSGGPGDPVQRFGLLLRDVRPVREGRGRTRSGRLPASLLFCDLRL